MPDEGICDHGYYVEECPVCNYEPQQMSLEEFAESMGDDESVWGYDGDCL